MKINTTIINNIKNNIFYRSQAAIEDYHNFDWHKNKIGIPDTDKINSSQALTIDFWGCLRNSPEKDKIINYLFNRDEYDWDIKFEYTEKELLNEPKPTQRDVLLVSTKNAIVIES